MDRRNPESHLGDEAVEPSSKRRKYQHLFPQQEGLLGNNATEGEEEEEKGPDWSEILEDILELITAHLHIGDRIQTSRVCKRWRSIVVQASPRSRPASYGSPCLLRLLDGPRRRCMLTDHFRDEHYVIDTPSVPQSVLIEHSNNGWMLLTKHYMNDTAVLLFNPLTQATVELPKLETNKFYAFSFLSEPTSSEFRVIGKSISFLIYSTSFCYWAPGQKDWNFFTINHQESIFQASNHRPFLLEDRIYHLDNGGRLGIYDLSDQKLTVIGEPPIKVRIFHSHYYNFVKMDGKLIFVYKEDNTIHLYELDESKQQQWIKLESTGGRSLFCCLANCIFTEATSRAEVERVYAWDIADVEIMMSCGCATNELQTARKFEGDTEDDLRFNWANVCWIN